ncbi:MAG: hypothetical protein LBJ72_06960 [Dysgonamonadaceae bacterium]|jgi:predicted RNA-binding Zn-ribbon protein involved in translation (DUF1610 family)|nr:hypothetical protein [Dysgonamonadaceae bacterium]
MRKLLLIGIFACLAFSCEDELYSTIPWAPVNFQLNLNGEDSSLNGSLSYKIFTRARLAADKTGYGGLLVINAVGGNILNLKAFDLSCPVEVAVGTKIKPDAEGLTATCPKCGAVYNISSSGAPVSGSKYPLKQYNVSKASGISGTYVVTN